MALPGVGSRIFIEPTGMSSFRWSSSNDSHESSLPRRTTAVRLTKPSASPVVHLAGSWVCLLGNWEKVSRSNFIRAC